MSKKNIAKQRAQRKVERNSKRDHWPDRRTRRKTAVGLTSASTLLAARGWALQSRQFESPLLHFRWNMQRAAMLALCSTCVMVLAIPACGGASKPHVRSFREQSVEITSLPKDAVVYLNDIQSSPVAKVDASGQLISRTAYHPYGQVRYQSGKSGDPWGFVGNAEDRGSGLSHFHARLYRPELGMFASVDPMALHQPEKLKTPSQMYAYVYGAGSPTNYLDRTGQTITIADPGEAAGVMTQLQKLSDDRLTYSKGKVTIAESSKDPRRWAGTTLMRELIGSKHDVSIRFGDESITEGNRTRVSDARVTLSRTGTGNMWVRQDAFALSRQVQPIPFIELGHELVHAYHYMTGTHSGTERGSDERRFWVDGTIHTGRDFFNAEEAATTWGGGDRVRTGAASVDENSLRRENGLAERGAYDGHIMQ